MHSYVITGVIVLVLFNVKEGFISSRYTLSIVLIVLTLCPFILEKILSDWSFKRLNEKILVSVLLFGLTFLSLSKFQYSDRLIERSAGE